MFDQEKAEEIERRRKEWQERAVKRSVDRFGVEQGPSRF